MPQPVSIRVTLFVLGLFQFHMNVKREMKLTLPEILYSMYRNTRLYNSGRASVRTMF